MATAIARARFLSVAPRKVRLLADVIRGKTVADARNFLHHAVKGAAPILLKLLNSAAANAESAAALQRERVDADEMKVTEIQINGGPVMRRYQPQPHGRAGRIRKRSSHVDLVISD